MNISDNFKQAAKELFGMDKDKDDGASSKNEQRSESSVFERVQSEVIDSPEVFKGEPGGGFRYPAYGQDSDDYSEDRYRSEDESKETTIIAKGTTIIGRILTDGHLEIMGRIDGNIEAEGDIAVQGRIAGDIKGDHLGLYSCQIKGDIDAKSGVVISSESVVVGDVKTESMIMDGKLKGNIDVSHSIIFKSNSLLLGDITAQSLSVDSGAVINGMVTTVLPYSYESPFDNL